MRLRSEDYQKITIEFFLELIVMYTQVTQSQQDKYLLKYMYVLV